MLSKRIRGTLTLLIASCIVLTFFCPFRPIAAQAMPTASPFAPTPLLQIASVLGNAIQGKGTPDQTPLAIVANDVAPFWTAGQIGSQRAASELGVPVIFNAPIKPGDEVAQ